MAAEISKKQRGLRDDELLPVVEKCYKVLNGRLSRRFFPQWIGRTAAIRGEARDAEEWYGQIVHDILWKQMGLIVRDEQGRYTVSHQVIGEYLRRLDRQNLRRVRRFRWTRAALICLCLCVAAAASAAVYRAYIAPPPYEETYADNVMARALDAYIAAGMQYEALAKLTECAVSHPERFGEQLELYQNAIPYRGMGADSGLLYLSHMLETGKVMPWSGKPMDEDACTELLRLAEDRREEYALFASVLEFVMTDDYGNRQYGEEYPRLLASLLETDAEIAANLYQIVCAPHVVGKYADHSGLAESYKSLFDSIPKQNDHLNDEDASTSTVKLTRLEGTREEQLVELRKCGAFRAANKTLPGFR